MHRIRLAGLFVLAFSFLALSASAASAGIPNLKDKAKKKAEEALKKKVEGAEAPAQEAPAEGEAPTEPATGDEKPGEGVWVNYDFVPGSEVIFFDDFARDVVGNFPQRLELLDGNMEIAEYKGRRFLRGTTNGLFQIPLPEVLPSKFTLEFDLWAPDRWAWVRIQGALPDDYPGGQRPTQVEFSPWDMRAGLFDAGPKEGVAFTDFAEAVATQLMHCRVLADGKYLKVYVNELRVANFPNADFYRSNAIEFSIASSTEYPIYFADFRVAKSEKTMYDALVADGRVATHGILFDTGSDVIRPESTPTLKEIGTMLKEHADLKLRIEGHTDNVGDDASNQALSDKRAAAVRAHLVKEYGIGEDRLQAQGFGESKPVSSNDTAEGRQNNRRVELVKT